MSQEEGCIPYLTHTKKQVKQESVNSKAVVFTVTKGKLDHDQVQHYWLDFCVGQDPDFICTLTWWATSWRAFHYANKHMCTHMLPSGNSLLYFRCTIENLRDRENPISTVWGGQYQTWRASTNSSRSAVGARWRRAVWERYLSSPKPKTQYCQGSLCNPRNELRAGGELEKEAENEPGCSTALDSK